MALLVEDVRYSYFDGWAIHDSFKDEAFRLRSIILFWCGDYQGQGKIANMKHAGKYGCHWCMHPFNKGLGTSGSSYADNNRRYDYPDSARRADPDYGTDATDPDENLPPPSRTHDDMCTIGDNIDDLLPVDAARRREETGINGFCVLALLPLFCMLLDITLDWMHVVKNVWQEHIIRMLKGLGCPQKPRPPSYRKNGREMTPAERQQTQDIHASRLRLFHEVKQVRFLHTFYSIDSSTIRTRCPDTLRESCTGLPCLGDDDSKANTNRRSRWGIGPSRMDPPGSTGNGKVVQGHRIFAPHPVWCVALPPRWSRHERWHEGGARGCDQLHGCCGSG